jgi:hypothetical protein
MRSHGYETEATCLNAVMVALNNFLSFPDENYDCYSMKSDARIVIVVLIAATHLLLTFCRRGCLFCAVIC